MPRQDKTGPLGFGPMTGRGLGSCGVGMSWRRGFGRGFGRLWGWQARIGKNEEKEILEEEAEIMKQDLKDIESRLSELKGQK